MFRYVPVIQKSFPSSPKHDESEKSREQRRRTINYTGDETAEVIQTRLIMSFSSC